MIIGLAQVKPDKVDGSTEGSFAATHVVLGYCSGFQYEPSTFVFLSNPTPSFLGVRFRIYFLRTSHNVWCPLRLLYITVSSNVFNLEFSSATVVVSSEEGLVTTSAVEDIATVVVVEHPATEAALSRSRHFKHGGSKPSWAELICWARSVSFFFWRSSWADLKFSSSCFLWR